MLKNLINITAENALSEDEYQINKPSVLTLDQKDTIIHSLFNVYLLCAVSDLYREKMKAHKWSNN